MKKFWKTLMFALVGVFALSSCEDVPAPYEIPTEGGGNTPTVVVEPEGDGTLENPFNVAACIALVKEMEADVESGQAYYIKGKVASNSTTDATISQYGNMTFTMYDEGNPSNTFTAFQVYGPGKKKFTSVDQIKVGDDVVVYGKVVNFRGNTPETVGKGQAYVYSINNGGGDTPTPAASSKENPLTVSQAKTATGNNFVKGYIVGYIDGQKLAEGATFSVPSSAETEILLAETPDETNPDNVFPVQLPVGDIRNALELSAHPDYLKKEVLLYGSLETYFGVPGMKNTSWANIEGQSFGKDPESGEGGNTETATPEGDGTKENPFNVAAVINYVQGMGADVTSDKEVYVKGIVKANSTTEATISQYGNMNFTMIDKGFENAEFQAYQVYGLGGKKFTSASDIKVGDEVIVYGKVINYRGNTPETVGKGAAYVYSLNGKTEGGDTPGPQPTGDAKGTGTESDPYNVTAAISVYNASTTAAGVWVKGYIVGYVDGQVIASGSKFSGTDATSATNVLIADNANETDYTKCIPVQLPAGDVRTALNLKDNPGNYKAEVCLYGNIEKYFGVAGLKTVTKYVLGEGGNDEPDTPDNPDTDVQHVTIAEFLAKADTNTAYELTGTVANIKNTQYGNFDLVEGDASIYIYGLLDLEGQKKNFGSLGISEGDKITITGVYKLYNGKPEIENAQFIRKE